MYAQNNKRKTSTTNSKQNAEYQLIKPITRCAKYKNESR